MKFASMMGAALVAAAAILPAAASAQMERHHDRVVTRTVVRTERHDGYRPHVRRVCRTEYRHHKRIRICRTVRR